MQCLDLGHHRLVNRQPASGIDDQYIKKLLACVILGGLCDFERVTLVASFKKADVELFAQ